MTSQILIYLLIAIAIGGYVVSRKRAVAHVHQASADKDTTALHSLPRYYGYYTALWAGIPALILLVLWMSFEGTVINGSLADRIPESMQGKNISLVLNTVKLAASTGETPSAEMAPLVEHYQAAQTQSRWLKTVLVLVVSLAGAYFAYRRFAPAFRARVKVEGWIKGILLVCSSIAIITTVGIVVSVMFESLIFFKAVSPLEFLFGTHWSPTAADPTFGAVPLFVGTLLISFIALLIAVPIGLMAAIYLAEYADNRIRSVAKPVLELLAGIPTVVYGFFAVLTIAPFFRNTFGSLNESWFAESIRGIGHWVLSFECSSGTWFCQFLEGFGNFFATVNFSASSESALAAGVVMGVMIIPFVSSLSDDAISAVPQYLRDGSFGLGATKSEAIKQVVLPAALPGIVGGVLLAASRAIGETMIVVMAAGLAANMSVNPLQAVTTVTVQIVTLLTGDQEFDSAKTLSAFALALLLFLVTLVLNLFALRIVKKYREQYD